MEMLSNLKKLQPPVQGLKNKLYLFKALHLISSENS